MVLKNIMDRTKKNINGEKSIKKIINNTNLELLKILENNQQSILDYKAGKDRALGFLVGQVMKASKGKANPGAAQQILKNKLK